MNTAIVDLVKSGIAAASADPKVAAGLMAAGFVVGIAEAVRRWRKRKHKENPK